MAQSSEEPPFLTVGTDVSAKYRGAFCEANVKAVKKLVKCKITFTKTNTTVTLNNDCVKGLLKVGATVEAKNPDGQFMEGVVTKLTDASVYTVVFDDGDERTLRRTSLCLKGARHFNESETLDHLPLTDPENFGTPVVQDGKKRKKRRLSQAASMDDSETEREEQEAVSAKKKCLFDESIVGKVVIVESGSKRRNMWFPALGVNPSKNEVDLIRSKDNCLVRSFKDGKYHVINVKDAKEFSRHQDPVHGVLKGENRKLKAGVERAVTYLETGRIPVIWEDSSSDVIVHKDGEEDVKKFHGSEDESTGDDSEERNSFNESLTAFMKENGTPISRPPVLGNQDLNLHKLYKIVQDHGGMEKVSSEASLWRKIYRQMDIPVVPPSASHHIKMAYKKYLYPFELHQKEKSKLSKKGEDSESDAKSATSDKSSKADIPESPPDSSDEKNLKCFEPQPDIEDDDIVVKKAEPRQSSRGKEIKHESGSEAENGTRLKQVKQDRNHQLNNGVDSDTYGKNVDEDAPVDVVNSPESSSDVSESQDDGKSDTHTEEVSYEVGDKIQVKYGRGRNHKLYDAKIIHIDEEADNGVLYCIHYAGWNNRYDEWIKPDKISGWGTRQTRKRNGSANKVQESISKSTPKPMARPTAKPAGRHNSKAVVSAKDVGTRHSPATTNSVKAGLRPASPSTKSGSASPSLGKSPKTSTGRATIRTRSERNSSTDLSNGLDEAIKSPSSRRRQKSTTPEPSVTDQNELLDVVEDPQANIEEAKAEEPVNNKKNSVQKNSSEAYGKKEEGVVNSPLSDNGNSNDCPQEQDNDHSSNSKRKEKNKRTINGLTKTVRSPETVIKDNSSDFADGCSQPKQMKVEKEDDSQDKEVQQLLSNEHLAKSPNQPQQTQGSPTAMETVSCSLAMEEEKSDNPEESVASVSTACSDDSGRGSKPLDSSSSKKEHSEKNHEHSKDNKSEKKNSEHHHRKHKKRREKKKHRHASGNDSTGSDAPGSPLYNNSQGLASPSRPRISFDVDLEEIKAKEDSGERIRLLQDKINEMRKMYSSLKAEVASIDRKRKRLKKKREAAEAAEAHENSKSGSSSSSSLSTSSHTISSPSLTALDCR